MELLKYYVILRQDEGLLINGKKQGIHYMKNKYSDYLDNEINIFSSYTNDLKNGLEIRFSRENILFLTYYKNGKLHGKRLIWKNRYLSCYGSCSNDHLHGIYYAWEDGYLMNISNYLNGSLHGTHDIHSEKVSKFLYNAWRYRYKLYSKIFGKN